MIRATILLLAAFVFCGSACSNFDEAARPVVPPPGPPVGTDGGQDGGGPTGECKNFASENEQLLNAPTDSASIKKKVELPPP